MDKEKRYWLVGQIETIKNLCEISLILIKFNRDELLPTVLEYLHQEATGILEAHCIKVD